jgi:MYXO-CTERM domain-containing protein
VTATSANFMAAQCTDLGSGRLADLVAKGTTVDTTVGDLFRAPNVTNGASCNVQFNQNIWLMVDQSEDGLPDAAFADASAPKLAIHLDGQGPPPPTDIKVTPGNEALSVSWTNGGLVDDQNGYVVFCSRADLPVFSPSFYNTDQFATEKTACHMATTPTKSALTVAATAAAASSATVIPAPDAFQQPNPDFVCSSLITTGTDFRIKGLQNGIPYVVGVAAVDAAGNASPASTALVQAPVPTVGFYDAYRAAGGQASGCSYGGGSAGGAALLVLALGLGWRRRR